MNRQDNIIGAVCVSEQYNIKKEISFEEILLDETLIEGEVWVWPEAIKRVGGVNYRLDAKQNYELILRIAREYKVWQFPQKIFQSYLKEIGKEREYWLLEETNNSNKEEEGIKTDCYLIGRYKKELLDLKEFDNAILGIISVGNESVTKYLEQMIMESKEFYDIYDCTQPILIYIGSDLCYNILDTFSECLGCALEEQGQRVEYFDISKHKIEDLADYTKRRYKAVIGMQTYMFSVRWKDGRFAHDSIEAPKYHFAFDHPVWLKEHLMQSPQRFCVLVPDGNYVRFIKKYYDRMARFLPPAGEEELFWKADRRDYEVVFVGSYGEGLSENLQFITRFEKEKAYLLNRYILYMRRNINEAPEYAFERALKYYGISFSREEFVERFYEVRWIIFWLANYYRNKIIKVILDAGIKVHVFGDSWKKSPVWKHSFLVCHEAVRGKDALKVYSRSKLSLNVMMWHKDGFTERVANAMLQKSVVVTDRTDYLEKNFVNGEELLMFDLRHLKELPAQIKELLNDEERRKRIAENGYEKALKHHTWRQRARQLLEWIEEDKE